MGLVFGEMSIIEMPINRASPPTDVIQVMLFFSKTYLPPFCFGKNLSLVYLVENVLDHVLISVG